MKSYDLTITIRIGVESPLTLFDTIREMENNTVYSLSDTENVRVLETEILNPNCQRAKAMKWFTGCRTLDEVKGMYKKLAKQYHPDLVGDTLTM